MTGLPRVLLIELASFSASTEALPSGRINRRWKGLEDFTPPSAVVPSYAWTVASICLICSEVPLTTMDSVPGAGLDDRAAIGTRIQLGQLGHHVCRVGERQLD